MIIVGKSRGDGAQLGQYLESKGENERVELREIKGLFGETAAEAMLEMSLLASGSRSEKPFYHAEINPEPGEVMTREQWKEAVDILEEKLGLQGQPRIVVMHEKNGREHAHIVWLRVDLLRNVLISDSHNYRKHEQAAREMERRFGHDRVQGAHAERGDQPRPERRPGHEEMQKAKETKLTPEQAKAWITALWQATDSGKAFKAALESQGWVLARGDRRDFVLIDPYGKDHNLARRVDGVRAAGVRDRMKDISARSLPSVAQAKQQQRALHADRATTPQPDRAPEPAREAPRDPIHTGQQEPHSQQAAPELGKDAGNVRLAWSLTDSGPGFVKAMQDRGYMFACVSAAEAAESQRVNALAKAVGNYAPAFEAGELVAVNRFGSAIRITERTTGDSAGQIEKHLAGVDRTGLLNLTSTREVMKEISRQEFSAKMQAARPHTYVESIVQRGMDTARVQQNADAKLMAFGGRFIVARATAADIEQVRAEQTARAMPNGWSVYRAEHGKDWTSPQMQEGDFFAVSSNGRAHRLNPHRIDTKALEARHAAEGQHIGSIAEARSAMQQQAGERHAERDARRAAWEKAQADRNSPARHFGAGAADAGKEAGLTVRDVASNTTQRLTSFIGGLLNAFLGGGSIKASYSTESVTERAAAYKAQRLSRDALRSIRDSIDRDEPLRAEDVRNLFPDLLENIRARGDAALLDQIRRMEEDRTRDYERGRTREL